MANKDSKGGMQSGSTPPKKSVSSKAPTTKKNNEANPAKSTQQGLSEQYDRETFIINVDLMEKIKAITYWDRLLLKETVEAAFTHYVESWEKKNGPLKDRPAEVKEREKLRSNSGRKKGGASK